MTHRGDSEATTAIPVDWGRAKEIFFDALDLDRAERAVHIESACRGDAGLREAVRRLIASHEHATDFLVEHPSRAPDPVEAPPALPRAIGPYEPVEILGEGGHGTVYRALQHAPVEREVAIKLLKPSIDSAEAVTRFADERRFLARMDHPDIVKIHDAGATADGRLFVAMELVRGVPLTAFAEERGLRVAERVGLVARLCRAVQHAHQRAVIHRDLKPSNVLVSEDESGVRLRVIDFGIAAALAEDDARGRHARGLGTPRYMSPEQAGSGFPIDTRSDVYAIGVMLCELLTGRPPRDPMTGAESASTPVSATPPSRLVPPRASGPVRGPRELRGELDRVVLRCVEWNPEDRYESAAALADDLERYLAGHAVRAMPQTGLYLAGKFVRRHRLAVGLSLLAVGSLAGGFAVAVRERSEAVAQRRIAESARADSDRHAAQARFVTAFLLDDMLAAADPDARPGRDVTVAELLETAAAGAQARFASDPVLLADVKGRLGVAFERVGRSAEAERMLSDAIALGGEAADPERLLSWRLERANATLLLPGRHKEAGEMFVALARDARDALGPDHPLTLHARLRASEYIEDRSARDDEVAEIERLSRAPGAVDPGLRTQILRYAALALSGGGEHEAAARVFQEATAISREQLGPMHSETVKLEFRLAQNMIESGDPDAGQALLRDALARAESIYSEGHPELTGMRRLAVGLFISAGRPGEAVEVATRFAADSAREHGEGSIPHTSAMQEVGKALLADDRPAEALEILEDALARRQSQWGTRHTQVAYTHRAIADALLALGRYAESVEQADAAMQILGPKSPSYFAAGMTRFRALAAAGRPTEAEELKRTLLDEAARNGAPAGTIERLAALGLPSP